MTTARRKDIDHTGTLEAILYNLTLGNGMNLDDGCRGDGVTQHPQITVSTALIDDATSKGLNNGSHQYHHHQQLQNSKNSSSTNNATNNSGSRPISQYLQVPQADLSKLSVMPCQEYSH